MKKTGNKKRAKRSRPVHDRQSKKRLQQEVMAQYGRDSGQAAEQDDRDWQAWEAPLTPGRPGTQVEETPADPNQTGVAVDDSAIATGAGQVVALASGLCWVHMAEQRIQATLPSRLARQQRSHLAVGDEVRLQQLEDTTWRVLDVLPRRTELSRPDPQNPRRRRLIAANIDQVVIVASVVAPPLRLALIDRYLITVDRGGAAPIIVINKMDLLPDDGARQRHLATLDPYVEQGLPILPCSTHSGRGIEALRAALAGKISVVVGHSGVGKSSLLNALDPSYKIQTAAVSSGGSGRHTTTGSGLYTLEGGIRLIDTPGIRELGLGALDPLHLQHYFPELQGFSAGCRFSNCTHLHEPDCAVRQALRDGAIESHRFNTYRRLMQSLEDEDLSP